MTTTTGQTYEVQGRLLEVCTCNVLCPCWVTKCEREPGLCGLTAKMWRRRRKT